MQLIRCFAVDCAMRVLASPVVKTMWSAKTLDESRGNDFPNRRFFIIRRREYGIGLFSYFWTNIGWINYAETRGMIPVVDMAAYNTIYHSSGGHAHENAWELFFEQPCGYGLNDVEKAHSVSFAASSLPAWSLPRLGAWKNVERNPTLLYWRDVVRRNIKPRKDKLEAFRIPEFEEALPRGVIGVLARGTDYIKVRPVGHPVQPDVDMIINAVEQYSKEGHDDERIFLVKEDDSIADKIVSHFKKRVILSNQYLIKYSGGFLGRVKDVIGNKDRGYRYLRAILDLSRCSALIAGRTSGTVGAVLLSHGFKYARVFNLGNYS